MIDRRWRLLVLLPMVAGTAAASAPKPVAPPASIATLTDCRRLADDGERLRCFDREVAALEDKVRTREVAVVDRADVRKTRRTLFGIPLPSVKLFANDDEPEIKEINATVRSVSRDGDGRLLFTLDDGAVWQQTDDFPLAGSVRAGHKVTLKRAAFGSYFADFEKAVPVRAKRVR